MSAPTDEHDHDHPDIPPPSVEEVSDGVFAYVQLDGSWGLNNSGFLVGRDAVTVIDTCFTERRTRALIDTIASVTPGPLRTLVNTHHHGDHTHGNHLVPTATIIGHERCREEMIESGHIATSLFPGVDWGRLEVAPPFVCFDDRLDLYVDDTKVELQFVGPAHTTNDVVAWLPHQRVLFAGDLVFNGGTPFVVMGSVSGVARRARAHPPPRRGRDRPGPWSGVRHHCDRRPSRLPSLRAGTGPPRLRRRHAPARPRGRRGPRPRSRACTIPSASSATCTARIPSCAASPSASPIDPQAFADMITYNGGRPLRCMA